MATLGEAKVNIRANLAPLRAGLKQAFALVTGAMRRLASTITSVMRRALKWGVIGLTGISIAAIKLAADVQESENLFDVSMGNMAESTRKWSKMLARDFGIAGYEIRRFVATFNVMLGSMGLGADDAANMSKQLTELAYDMSSFYNLAPADAFQKLQAGISGEIEPLKRLGILINETTTKQWALNNGLIVGTQKLTEQQKVYARFRLVMEQTGKAQGDLARTSGSLTNTWRSMWSQIKELGVAVGTLLIPQVTKAATAMRDLLVSNQQKIVAYTKLTITAAGTLGSYFKHDFVNAIGEMTAVIGKMFKALAKSIIDIIDFTFDYLSNKKAGGAWDWMAKRYVELFASDAIDIPSHKGILGIPSIYGGFKTPSGYNANPFDRSMDDLIAKLGDNLGQAWAESTGVGQFGTILKDFGNRWREISNMATTREQQQRSPYGGAVHPPGAMGAATAGGGRTGSMGFSSPRDLWHQIAQGINRSAEKIGREQLAVQQQLLTQARRQTDLIEQRLHVGVAP